MLGWTETTATGEPDLVASERVRIVRLCTRLTGDAHAAEDLAQDTLLVALQHERALRDPEKRQQWLSGIARNLCLHWRRRRGLETRRSIDRRPLDDLGKADDDLLFADTLDMEGDLERRELIGLLDRAMAMLPPDTRQALVERYVRENPHAAIAEHLGLSEDAAKKKVERGKIALRRVLATTLRAEAAAYGLSPAEDQTWQPTSLWCPGCGRAKLVGRFQHERGKLFLRCPLCSPPDLHYIAATWPAGLAGIHTFRPGVSRVLGFIHDLFHVRPVDGRVLCLGCQHWLPIQFGTPPWVALRAENLQSIYLYCPRCQCHDYESWHSLTWCLPEVRRFWQENPRMRFQPAREIHVEGRPAILTGFESLTGQVRIDVVTGRDTLQVVQINGVAPGPATRP